jgi:hypothetical protein
MTCMKNVNKLDFKNQGHDDHIWLTVYRCWNADLFFRTELIVFYFYLFLFGFIIRTVQPKSSMLYDFH